MTDNTYNYTKGTEYAAYAPIRKAVDVTPSPTTIVNSRAIMVSEFATVTGELIEQPGTSHTTFSLTPGMLYPFCFKYITAVSSGTVKAYK